MEKKTVRQFSLLGLVLMGASALTAAVVPTKPADVREGSADNGRALQFSANNDAVQASLSCAVQAGTPDCHVTAGTLSTVAGGNGTFIVTDDGGQYQTEGNTSASRIGNGFDTTSNTVLVP